MKKISLLCALLLLLAGCAAAPSANHTPPPEVSPSAPALPPAEILPTPEVTESAPVETVEVVESSPPTTSEPVPAPPQGWDGRLETLTLADFPTELAVSAELSAQDKPLYLLAQLPDQGTWLYGWHGPQKEQGLILRVGDDWQFFEISYLTPRITLPEISYGDFDGDLELELALQVYEASGTGVSVWGLYVIELNDGLWSLHKLSRDDYLAILDSAVSRSYDPATGMLTVSAADAALDIPLDPALVGDFQRVAFGDTVRFSVSGDGIRATFDGWLGASLVPATTTYLVSVSADVIYTGSVFGLDNFSLAPAG